MSYLIDRQAAIDALHMHLMYRMGTDSNKKRLDEWINNLPPAQPEIIRCKDCKHGVDYYHDGSCYCAKPGYELLYFDGSWEFYCANAERREG